MRALISLLILTALAVACEPVTNESPEWNLRAAKVLNPLMTFHPGWVTKQWSSHDPTGDNADGEGVVQKEGDYQVLFHSKGEGRITRIWMTADLKSKAYINDWRELWIQIDGQTVFRGPAYDFFRGAGPWKAPLVLDFESSSGGFTSYVPFSYKHEAKILLLGTAHYYQVGYREGPGSSEGPSAEDISGFLSDPWWQWSLNDHGRRIQTLLPNRAMTVAVGPILLRKLSLLIPPDGLSHLKIQVGEDTPIPIGFFFGLPTLGTEKNDSGGLRAWASVKSALHFVDPETGIMATRLPVPLGPGQTLKLISDTNISVAIQLEITSLQTEGVRLATQFISQKSNQSPTTMNVFSTDKPVQFVSLIERVGEGAPGDRGYLEGDEMIRTDKLAAPLIIGTGTEDYFNGAWYFLGRHSNPLTGQPRIEANQTWGDWSQAIFNAGMYRHHVLDPITSRSGFRFGFEAGARGGHPVGTYHTLGLAYLFESFSSSQKTNFPFLGTGTTLTSAIDGEFALPPQTFKVSYSQKHTEFEVTCPLKAEKGGVLLVRTYDAKVAGQEALVLVDGKASGLFFEGQSNPIRRIKQNALWISLDGGCPRGSLHISIVPQGSKTWSAIGYETQFFIDRH